jgi:hypothetical protein
MSFTERTKKSTNAIQRFTDFCKKNKVEFAHCGYEHWNKTDNFQKWMRDSEDKTAIRIRYFPDIMTMTMTKAITKGTLTEVKSGNFIEKAAYDNYMDLHRIGYNVGIVFLHKDRLNFCYIQDVKLEKLADVFIGAPVVDGIWVSPRNLSEEKYLEWQRSRKKSSSGTTFGIIDFPNMKFTILKED